MRLILLLLGLLIMAVIASGFSEQREQVWCPKQGKMVDASRCPCRQRAKRGVK